MIEATSVALTGLASLLAGYAALYLAVAVIAPRYFLDDLSLTDERFKKLPLNPGTAATYRWTFYAASGALLVGLLILMFHSAGALTMWIPASWIETGDDGERRWVGWSIQLVVGLFFVAAISEAFLSRDANAHRLVEPTRWRLSAWARRGYDRAEELIEGSNGARRSEIDLKPSHFAMEFMAGFNIRLAEEGDRDAPAGRYRPAAFEDSDAYVEAWWQSATRLRMSGWRHPKIDEALDKLEAARKAAATARDKEFWKATLGFDPDEVLGET